MISFANRIGSVVFRRRLQSLLARKSGESIDNINTINFFYGRFIYMFLTFS